MDSGRVTQSPSIDRRKDRYFAKLKAENSLIVLGFCVSLSNGVMSLQFAESSRAEEASIGCYSRPLQNCVRLLQV